jgi:ubiquinone/menaquinone biosynthesis C-methylase UbiE
MNNKFIKLDDWCRDIVVDPLGKQALIVSSDGNFLETSYCRKYPVVNGIYDLRLLNSNVTDDQKLWKKGQIEYEKSSSKIISSDKNIDYTVEKEAMKVVYEKIPVEGDCLDVGGHQGRLREFLNSDQKYVTCDPYMNVFDNIYERPNLLKAYPFLVEPVNFVCCHAEFLPFKSNSFQTVHMRSVIDHFLNPELALNEAYRVLKKDGGLIIGSYINGGKHGRVSFDRYAKDVVKKCLHAIGVSKWDDHHIWHPGYKELIELLSICNFEIDKVYWQNDSICYVKALKK